MKSLFPRLSLSLTLFGLLGFALFGLSQSVASSADLGTTTRADASQHPIQFLTEAQAGDPVDIALNYINAQQGALGLTATDLTDYNLSHYYTEVSDFTQVELGQTLNGIPVHNGMILVNVAGDGSIINLHNNFVPNLTNAANLTSPTLSASEAVESAASKLGLTIDGVLRSGRVTDAATQAVVFESAGISQNSIPASLVYSPNTKQGTRLAWAVEIKEINTFDWWLLHVDAETGQVIYQFNYTIHEDFAAQADQAHGEGHVDRLRQANSAAYEAQSQAISVPFVAAADTYNVYPWPVESPNHVTPLPPADSRTVVNNPVADGSANATPFGWHNDGTTSYTTTQGNNVDAQKGGTESNCGATLDCNHALDLTVDPTVGSNVDAAIDNLFYWNNITHDVWYQYGFDEVAGNFQEDNNGMGGAGGDGVTANAQAPGNCNANMSTPTDGGNPTMNMFTCDIATPTRDGDFDNGVIVHEYTHGISIRQTGGPGNSGCLNNSEQMGEGWSDWYGLIMTVEPGDTGPDPRGIGTWLLGTGPDGPGVREHRYSTDLTENPHTYGDLGGVAIPHGVGSIWAAMLWEMTWGLVDNGSQSGLDPDIYNGTGGNNLAMQLVNDGLKLQPCSPGFEDGRDAILLADQNLTGGANQCVIWEAFAKRGMGFSADQGSSGSASDGTEAFDMPPICLETLKITKTATPDPVTAGGTLTYNLLIENDTAGTLTNVTATDTIEAGQTYVGGSATCGGSEAGGVVSFPLGTMASSTSQSCSFQVTIDGGLGSTLFFSDDFEAGLGNWATTGLWNLESDTDTCGSTQTPFPSATNAAYYGQDGTCTYDTGAATAGELTMNSDVALTGSPILNFSYLLATENFAGFDEAFVQISTDGGTTWTNLAQLAESAWTSSSADLSAYSGQNARIRFTFDSGDEQFNGFFGVMVDDVEIIDEASVSNTACVTATEGDNNCDSITVSVLPSVGADFTISATPPSLDVCAGSDGVFTVDVGSLNGFTDPVTLSAASTPGGAGISFDTNPVIPAGSSQMTVSSPASSYAIDVTGTGSSGTHMASVALNLLSAPTAPTLTSPADTATDVATSPTYTWSDTGAASYDIEIATDAAFSNIVDSATVATNSYSGAALSTNTTYYWHVSSSNSCGTSANSADFSFTTADVPPPAPSYCSTPNVAIPDADANGVSDTITVAAGGTLNDLNVGITATHTYVGDLIFTLTHVDSGTSVTLLDRPGYTGTGFGCGDDNIAATVDDESTDIVDAENHCAGTDPWISTSFVPEQPLSGFDSEDLSGDWTLTVSDNAGQDTGTLNEWCLLPDAGPPPAAPIIDVNPASMSSTQSADTTVDQTLTINNIGTADLTWTITEDDNVAPVAKQPAPVVEETVVNPQRSEAESAQSRADFFQQFAADQQPAQNLTALPRTPCVGGTAGAYECDNVDLLAFMPLADIGGGSGNDIWGWTGCGTREFAIMGRTSGTAFVEITDPENPVYLGNLPTHTANSSWRDIKTYADHAFVVSEASGHGMQVFDLNQLCTATPGSTFSNTAHYSGFGNAHNIVINEDSGYAYGVGTSACSGGLAMVNINTPTSPTNAGCFSSDGYTHDAQCIIYNGPDATHVGSEICFNYNEDTLTIVDVTNKAAPVQLSRTGYTGSAYTHQGWVTDDHAYVLMDDELDEQNNSHNTRTRIFDVSDLDSPSLIGVHDGTTAAIDHNLYVKDGYAYEANYRAGLQIMDLADVANGNLSQAAFFDIYPGSNSAAFNGAWSVYPYFDSGVVIVSGIEQGLFVLDPFPTPPAPPACSAPIDIPWLSVSPAAGTTAPAGSTNVTVTYDSAGLASGTYTGTLCIDSNDPVTPQVQVPVTLIVADCSAPNAPGDVTITENSGDVTLDWASTGDSEYQIWWELNDPYFMPTGMSDATTATNTYTHVGGGVGNVGDNYYYVVANSCGQVGGGGTFDRTAEFDYNIVPGTP